MTDTKAPDSLRPGDVVGPWRVEGYCGRGSYGVVYRARRAGHPGSVPVALKLAVFPSDPRFSREVELLSRTAHPSVPQLVDRGWWQASAEATHPYVAMEWIRGQPLYEWARVQRPTSREVLQVVAQVAWGLEVLHRGGCLHRDVKGHNILVEPEGRAVLTDFGSGTWKGAPPLTERVVAPNTREYRSPESLRFEWGHWSTPGAHYEASPADDVYALGVTAYRLVTGVYPPPGTAPEEQKEQLRQPALRRLPVRVFNRRVLPELAALIERMLEEEPEARGTAREVAAAAERAAERARPGMDMPLFDKESPQDEDEAVWSRGIPVSGAEPVADEASERMPVVVPVESAARSRQWRRVLLGATLSLAVVALWWREPEVSPEATEVVRAEVPDAGMAPDAGTRGLGDDALTTRVEASMAPSTLEAVALQIPKQPLPGQQRPPCQRSWGVVINGGCWKLLAGSSPPCDEGEYEWQGGCYEPALERSRPPTSTKPR